MNTNVIDSVEKNRVCHSDTVFFFYKTTSNNICILSVKIDEIKSLKNIKRIKVNADSEKDAFFVVPEDLKITARSAYYIVVDALGSGTSNIIDKRLAVEEATNTQPAQQVFTCKLVGC